LIGQGKGVNRERKEKRLKRKRIKSFCFLVKRKFMIEWVNMIMSIEGQRDREIGRWRIIKK